MLDTQVMTLRVCGHELASPEGLEARQRLGAAEGAAAAAAAPDAGAKYHFEVCGSLMACFPHTHTLECMLHRSWIAHVASAGMSIEGPATLPLAPSPAGERLPYFARRDAGQWPWVPWVLRDRRLAPARHGRMCAWVMLVAVLLVLLLGKAPSIC